MVCPLARIASDRILVAQAGAERAAVVSRDPAFAPYGVTLIW
jgi:PIN domain nuclease of toxin-antitoxin system